MLKKAMALSLFFLILLIPISCALEYPIKVRANEKDLEINGNKELSEFIREHHFPGNGASENPYVIPHGFHTMRFENISLHLILRNIWCDNFLMYNVSNAIIEDSNLYPTMMIFRSAHNISLVRSTLDDSWVYFYNSTHIRLEKLSTHSSYNLLFTNVSYISIENISGYYMINLKKTEQAALKNISGPYIYISESKNFLISGMYLSGGSDGVISIENTEGIWMENVDFSGDNFHKDIIMYNVSKVMLCNSTIFSLSIMGTKNPVKYVKLENLKISWADGGVYLGGIQNLDISNIHIVPAESNRELYCGIFMKDDFHINMENIHISGPFTNGICGHNLSYGVLKDLHISITPMSGMISAHSGILLENSTYIIIERSYFDDEEKVGIQIVNSTKIKIKDTHFSWKIENPIKFDGEVRYILLQENTGGRIAHPHALELLMFFIIFILLLITSIAEKRKMEIEEANREFLNKIRNMK